MVAGAFQRLRHEKHVETLLAGSAIVVLDMPQKYQVAQAVEFGIGTQHRQRSDSDRAD